MKTVIKGKVIEKKYSVDHKWNSITDENGEFKTVYIGKPELKEDVVLVGFKDICSFEGDYVTNRVNLRYLSNKINISETESVNIEKTVFRADKNEQHVFTDKILKETNINKKESEQILKCQIAKFNKMMIKSNDRLKAYCDLHKLDYSECDVDELFKVVYPDNLTYKIVDGKLIAIEKKQISYVSSAINEACNAVQATWGVPCVRSASN